MVNARRIVMVGATIGAAVPLFIFAARWTASDQRGNGTNRSIEISNDDALPPNVDCQSSRPIGLTPPACPTRRPLPQELGNFATVFEQNVGQWRPELRFGARGNGLNAALTDGGIVLSAKGQDESGDGYVQAIEISFGKLAHAVIPQGRGVLSGIHNYFIGSDPINWHTGVPLFESVEYIGVVPGVDIEVLARDGKISYDLSVAPGADLDAVEFRCEGVDSIAIEPDGTLTLATPVGEFRQSCPVAWYECASGKTDPVSCSFRLIGSDSFGFSISHRDPDQKVIVDPGLMWSTYFGSGGTDETIWSMDIQSGLVTIAGQTNYDPGSSTSPFPITAGSFQTTPASPGTADDAFVSRLNPTRAGAQQLVWSTFLGGDQSDVAYAIAVHSSGSVAVTGNTHSTNFPTKYPYISSPLSPGGGDSFVTYLNPTGSQLFYSTYYGANTGLTTGRAIALASDSTITIAGFTTASNLPLASNPYDNDFGGSHDAFVARFLPVSSGSFLGATYVGGRGSAFGNSDDIAYAVAIGNSSVYVAGYESSGISGTTVGWDTTGQPYDSVFNGNADAFVVRLDSGLTTLQYSTAIGGSAFDMIQGMVVHNGVVYACGTTWSNDFPVTGVEAAAFDSSFWAGSFQDCFALKLDPTITVPTTADQLRYSTYLGGEQVEFAYSIARVTDFSVVVVGRTLSQYFPVGAIFSPPPPPVTVNQGLYDCFVTRLNWLQGKPPSQQLDFSTFLGGTGEDWANSVVSDGANVYVAGSTRSSGFPTAGSPYDSTYNGGVSWGDGFVTLYVLPPLTFP